MKRISFPEYVHLASQIHLYLEHVGRLLDASLWACHGRLGRDVVVPQLLQLALIVLVRQLLVLFNDLVHLHLASSGDVVWRSDVHDPVFVSLALPCLSALHVC